MPWLNIEEAINQARSEGQFDNLPGQGQRLNLSGDDVYAGDNWAANQLLKNAGFVPEPIQRRREIFAAIEQAMQAIERAWATTSRARALGHSGPRMEERWQRSRADFLAAVETINTAIRDLNLSTDVAALHLPPLNAERRLQDVMSVTRRS